MATIKYSKQRASILDYLSDTKEHPTADTVYSDLRKTNPNISLGTVYRNLNLLADMGEIMKITTENGGVRFDYNTAPHYHVICKNCGSVQDLMLDADKVSEFIDLAESAYDGTIDSHSLLFYGSCNKCR
ncbi:MAG: transcriptional repressor [Suipraeoptans sp.]